MPFQSPTAQAGILIENRSKYIVILDSSLTIVFLTQETTEKYNPFCNQRNNTALPEISTILPSVFERSFHNYC